MQASCNADAPSSTPRHSAPPAFFFSAPASPTHFLLSSSPAHSPYAYASSATCDHDQADFEFHLAARSMSTADELFINGQVRPGFISFDQATLPRPEPAHRRTWSVSPARASLSLKSKAEEADTELNPNGGASERTRSDELESPSASTSRSSSSNSSSSSNTNSKRWRFIKDFLLLQRSKSEGAVPPAEAGSRPVQRQRSDSCVNGLNGRRKTRHSAACGPALYREHLGEKAEARRRMTFLPYRQQGFLFGCLGFGSSRLARSVGVATATASARRT